MPLALAPTVQQSAVGPINSEVSSILCSQNNPFSPCQSPHPNNTSVTVEKILNLGHGEGREREKKRGGEEERRREKEGRDNFLNPCIFIPLYAVSP